MRGGNILKNLIKKINNIELKAIDITAIALLVLLICIVNVTNSDLTLNPDLRFL